jgi:hypothetical protein
MLVTRCFGSAGRAEGPITSGKGELGRSGIAVTKAPPLFPTPTKRSIPQHVDGQSQNKVDGKGDECSVWSGCVRGPSDLDAIQ